MGAALAAPIAAVAVLVALACLALARPEPAPAATSTATLEQSFLGAVNRQRLGHGRRPVRLDSRLRHAARFHSETWCGVTTSLTETSPIGSQASARLAPG